MGITEDLQAILDARYGRDVRQAIHDGIEEGYNIAVQAQGAAQTAQDSASAYADAALASEQAAADAQAAAEAAAEEAMSGTPAGYAALVSKVNSLHNSSDVSFALIGTAEGSALAHSIYGMSVQNGTPTPSVPVEIKNAKANFKCVGKNLIPYPYFRGDSYSSNGIDYVVNAEKTISFSGSTSGDSYYTLFSHTSNTDAPIFLKPSTAYKLIFEAHSNLAITVYLNAVQSGSSGDLVNTAATNTTKVESFTTPADFNNRLTLGIQIHNKANISGTVKLSIVEADVTDTTYKPYQHKDITTNLVLRAIEVTSADNYNLVKDGKYYVADTIDWSEDEGYQITRRVERFNVTKLSVGNDAKFASITNTNWDFTKYVLPNASNITPQVYNNYFVPTNSSGITESGGDGKTYYNASNHLLYIRVDVMTSQADWNTWLSNHSDMYVDLILATPTTEPITSEQAQALLGLKTYDEATSIDCVEDVAPVMDLEYSKDRNTALALTGHNMAYINDLRIGELENAAADD